MQLSDTNLLAEEVRNYAQGVEGALGLLGQLGIPLQPSSKLMTRRPALEALARKLPSIIGPLRGPELDSDQWALLLLALDRAIERTKSEIAKLRKLSPNPEVTSVHDQRLRSLSTIRAWPFFATVSPAAHVGIGNYLDAAAIAKLSKENVRLIQTFSDGDVDATAPDCGEALGREVSAYLQRHDSSEDSIRRRMRKVKDVRVREIARRDALEAVRLLCLDSWKAAYILAGTVIEGLLREMLDRAHSRQVLETAFRATYPGVSRPPHLDDYRLAQLIDVQLQLAMVDKTAAKLLHGVRDLRNFVHVQAEAKQKFKVNRRHASFAVNEMLTAIDRL